MCFQEANKSFSTYKIADDRRRVCFFKSWVQRCWKIWEQLRDQLVYGLASMELCGKMLSAAYGENLTWAKILDIVNNFECTAQSFHKFQQTLTQLRTDQLTTKREGNRPGSDRDKQWMSDRRGETSKPCIHCLGTGHSQQTCRYKEFQCWARRLDFLKGLAGGEYQFNSRGFIGMRNIC